MQSDLELASLLASRLCHDVVGPVGAIQNGLELIAEDQSMTDMAMELIRKSAAQATAKLQYARLAYGAAGGAAMLDPDEAGRATAAMFAGERATLDWRWSGPPAPRDGVKVAMIMATFALGAVPRGGTITVTREDDGSVVTLAEGSQVRMPPFSDVLAGDSSPSDPRAVQPLLLERLATASGWTVAAELGEGRLRLFTRPR